MLPQSRRLSLSGGFRFKISPLSVSLPWSVVGCKYPALFSSVELGIAACVS